MVAAMPIGMGEDSKSTKEATVFWGAVLILALVVFNPV